MKNLYLHLLTIVLFVVACSEENVVYNTAARAAFSTSEEVVELGTAISFTDASTPDAGDQITDWLWEFNDAAKSTSREQNPTFTYAEGGTFEVRLTVTDNNGLSANTTKSVTIIDPAKAINIMWEAPLLGAIENTVSPVLSPDESIVYMYTDQSANNAYDVQLKAYDIASGATKWAFNVNDAMAAVNPNGGVRLVYASPAVGPNGDVYVAVRDLENSGAARKSFMFAVMANGTQRWAYGLGLDGNFNYITPAIDAQGQIYLGHLTNSPFAVAVIDPATGEAAKKIETPVGIRSGLALSKGGDVYFCANGLFSYGQDGSQKFQFNSVFSVTGGAITVGSDGTIYTVGGTSSGGAIAAINPDGSLKWKYETASSIDYGGVVIGTDGTIYANGGKAVEGQTSAGVIALNKDGSLKWHFGTEEDANNGVPLVNNRGYIHIISDKAVYYIVKPDGTLFSSATLGVKTFSSPVMDSKGNLLIAVEKEAGGLLAVG